jgi:hypothetical protein
MIPMHQYGVTESKAGFDRFMGYESPDLGLQDRSQASVKRGFGCARVTHRQYLGEAYGYFLGLSDHTWRVSKLMGV